MTKEQTPQDANEATIGAVALDRRVSHLCENPWLEAAVAWEVCASIHERYAKGKDALYSTRRKDFLKHAEDARKMANRVGQAGPKAIACTVGLGACNFLAATPLGGPDEQIERAFGAMQVRRVSDGE